MDVTVVFSGHNIASFAKLAILSFKYHNPEITNIFYFDDFSNDNTRDIMRDLGVKIIEWEPEYYNRYLEILNRSLLYTGVHKLVVRCELIFKQILRSVNTTKLLLLDGDTVTLDKFSNSYFITDSSYISPYINVLGDYSKHLSNKLLSDYTHNIVCGGYMRVHPYCCVLNMCDLNISELSNNVFEDAYIRLLDGTVCDVGSDVWNMLTRNKSKITISKFQNVIHWGWISSSRRDTMLDSVMSYRDVSNELLSLISENREIRKMLKISNVSYKDLISVISNTKSNYL